MLTAKDLQTLLEVHNSKVGEMLRADKNTFESLSLLKEIGLIEPCPAEAKHRTSAKGKVYIEALCNTPEPIQIWAVKKQ
jgi:hypothetical protein